MNAAPCSVWNIALSTDRCYSLALYVVVSTDSRCQGCPVLPSSCVDSIGGLTPKAALHAEPAHFRTLGNAASAPCAFASRNSCNIPDTGRATLHVSSCDISLRSCESSSCTCHRGKISAANASPLVLPLSGGWKRFALSRRGRGQERASVIMRVPLEPRTEQRVHPPDKTYAACTTRVVISHRINRS
jgi:hypothetical protein